MRTWEVYKKDTVEALIEKWGFPRKTVKRYDDIMVKAAELCLGETVLDVGCGFGHLRHYLPENVKYAGIDVSPNMIKKAREINPNTTFQRGDVYDLSGYGLFDTVYALSLLNHLPSTYEPLEQLWNHARTSVIFNIYVGENGTEVRTIGYDGVQYDGIIYRHESTESLHRIFNKLNVPIIESYAFDNPELPDTKLFRLIRK